MKTYNIKFKNLFYNDITLIQDILYRFTFSKETTKNIINSIYSEIFKLSIFPNRYVEYKYWFRVLNIKWKYKVFYKVEEDKLEVHIYRILFSSSNYENLF